MEIIKKIIHLLSYVIYFCIFIFVLIEIPMIFGYKPLLILSGSMEPNYKVGSIVYYHKVRRDELKEKDVVTYELDDGTYITHRIVSIENDLYETKGDKNNSSDPVKIEYSSIVGKATNWSIPYIGYCYMLFLKYHTLIIVILAIILCMEFWFSNFKVFNKKEKEE